MSNPEFFSNDLRSLGVLVYWKRREKSLAIRYTYIWKKTSFVSFTSSYTKYKLIDFVFFAKKLGSVQNMLKMLLRSFEIETLQKDILYRNYIICFSNFKFSRWNLAFEISICVYENYIHNYIRNFQCQKIMS